MGSSVCRARIAVEQITKSGAIFARLRYAAIILAVCRPRLLRGLSWSFRPGSFRLDLAWRSRWRDFIAFRPGSGVDRTVAVADDWEHSSRVFQSCDPSQICRDF